MDNVPMIHIPTNKKCLLETTTVYPGVSLEGEMLGKLAGPKFMDHDITNEKKLPKLGREKYLCVRIIQGIG
jgi:hypothetical protein